MSNVNGSYMLLLFVFHLYYFYYDYHLFFIFQWPIIFDELLANNWNQLLQYGIHFDKDDFTTFKYFKHATGHDTFCKF